MKTINNFIDEKLKISSKSKFYSCWPKDKYELRNILKERLAEDKNANLNDIDVSQITDMGYKGFKNDIGLFEGLDPHNINISEWDVSNVTNMRCMFFECNNFNCDLSKWDVSKVKTMCGMFSQCSDFDGKGLENWNVSNVTDMRSMFYKCENFNADLINWDVSNITKPFYMKYMFKYCKSLKNKPSWYKE